MSTLFSRKSSMGSLTTDDSECSSRGPERLERSDSAERRPASLKRGASLHAPKTVKSPNAELKRKNSKLHAMSRRRASRRCKGADTTPVLDQKLLREEESRREQERAEFEVNKELFSARTQRRRKMFAPNADSAAAAAKRLAVVKERGRTRLLELSKRSNELSERYTFHDDDALSTDNYSMSFAQPTFKELTKFESEFNSQNRIRG